MRFVHWSWCGLVFFCFLLVSRFVFGEKTLVGNRSEAATRWERKYLYKRGNERERRALQKLKITVYKRRVFTIFISFWAFLTTLGWFLHGISLFFGAK